MTSPYIRQALELRGYVRAEFEDYRLMAYERASEACRGRLLNRRGFAANVDDYSLFMGNATRAYAYASEELVEHWERYPRLTFAEFERQHFSSSLE